MKNDGEGSRRDSAVSLYIHVPFCAGICGYCDFYSIPVKAGDPRIGRFIDAAVADTEIDLRRFGAGRVPSVYIGGGTPSLLGAAGIGRLLDGVMSLLPDPPRREAESAPREITVEANPESLDEPFLRACRDRGVSRISLGVQSFYERSRRAVRRMGDGALLPERLALVSAWYGNAFSADLMTGLPYQDENILLKDIEKLLSHKPGHVSLYSLTVEPGTPLAEYAGLGRTAGRQAPVLPGADEADRLWITGRDALEQAGYAQYEVSNFAPPENRSVHNIRYWRMENWLGIGPSASGTVIDDKTGTGRRYTHKADADAYLASLPAAEFPGTEIEELDRLTLVKETLLMGFRYIEGPDPVLFRRRFGLDMEDAISGTLAAWRNRGLLAPDKTALTGEGLLQLNRFVLDCFNELSFFKLRAAAFYSKSL
jgi:oxygen-independent coproporphyrinogen-3 oxidase